MSAPLVPAELDLRDFAFLPLDVVRLRDSSLAVEASGDEFRAAVLLWCVAWHQVPAASLPDDDRALAMYAGFGRGPSAVKDWKKVKAGALRGFVRCDDGRLYHQVLADKAMEAGGRKETGESNKERQRRWRERMKAMCDELRNLGVTPPAGASSTELETLLANARGVSETLNDNVTELTGRNVTNNVTEMDRQGQGQGQGQGHQELESPDGDSSPPAGGDLLGDQAEDADPPGVPHCPVQRIIALYHEALPQLARVREFPEQSAKMLRTRWRENPKRQSLEWWKKFFTYVGRCPFLVGEKTDFVADLMWLVRPTNFAKVVNGNYESRAA